MILENFRINRDRERGGYNRERDNRDRDRHHNSGSFQELEGYVPSAELIFKDDEGRILSTKDAFKHLSHKFHGNGPKWNKQVYIHLLHTSLFIYACMCMCVRLKGYVPSAELIFKDD